MHYMVTSNPATETRDLLFKKGGRPPPVEMKAAQRWQSVEAIYCVNYVFLRDQSRHRF
jgi:hypothetical protein